MKRLPRTIVTGGTAFGTIFAIVLVSFATAIKTDAAPPQAVLLVDQAEVVNSSAAAEPHLLVGTGQVFDTDEDSTEAIDQSTDSAIPVAGVIGDTITPATDLMGALNNPATITGAVEPTVSTPEVETIDESVSTEASDALRESIREAEQQAALNAHGDWVWTKQQIAESGYLTDDGKFDFRCLLEDAGATDIQFEYEETENDAGSELYRAYLHWQIGSNRYYLASGYYPNDGFMARILSVSVENGMTYYATAEFDYMMESGNTDIADASANHPALDDLIFDVSEEFFTDAEYLGDLIQTLSKGDIDGNCPFDGVLPHHYESPDGDSRFFLEPDHTAVQK